MLFPLSPRTTEEEMTGSLILDVILSVGIVLAIVGMLVWAVLADHQARVRIGVARGSIAPGNRSCHITLSSAPAGKATHDRRRLGRESTAASCGGQLAA
jgi:hypothetical protein